MKYLTFSLDADIKGLKVVVACSSVFYFHVNHVYTLAVVVCFTELITWINRYFYKQNRLTVSIPEGPKVQLIGQKFLWSVFTHVANTYENFLEQKKAFA